MERGPAPASCTPAAPPTEALVPGLQPDGTGTLLVASLRHDVATGVVEFPEGRLDGEIVEVTSTAGDVRLLVVAADLMTQIELTGDIGTGQRRITFVAYDAVGEELARAPLFPHLRP